MVERLEEDEFDSINPFVINKGNGKNKSNDIESHAISKK
jgi:hypothetical protein